MTAPSLFCHDTLAKKQLPKKATAHAVRFRAPDGSSRQLVFKMRFMHSENDAFCLSF